MTLPEIMVAMGVFGLSVVGMVYTQMFGMRQDELVNSKVGATEQARLSFNDLANDIRAAKIWQVGNLPTGGAPASFTGIPLNTTQKGNAIKVSLTTDTNTFWLYYFDTTACKLYRQHITGGTATTPATMLAQNLTNNMYFQAETYHGDAQTNLTHKGVIDVMMQFCQYQYPLTKIGPGFYYDFYKLQLRVTPQAPDGP